MFLKSTPIKIKNILRAAESKDWKLVERECHSLKSNAKTFGAEHLGELCETLEEHSALEASILSNVLLELENESQRVVADLAAVLSQT